MAVMGRSKVGVYDLACAALAPFIALALRNPDSLAIEGLADLASPAYAFALIAICSTLASFVALRVDKTWHYFFSVQDLLRIAGIAGAAAAVTAVFHFSLTRLDGVPRSAPFIHFFVLVALLGFGRAVHRTALDQRQTIGASARPEQLRNVIIVTADRFSAIAIKLIASQTPQTTRVVGLLDERANMKGRLIGGVRVIGAPSDLSEIIDEYAVHGIELDGVYISDASGGLSETATKALKEACAPGGIPILSLADALNLMPKQI
jgi:FlaA1/EpsC-like NDP-sugar epimerase